MHKISLKIHIFNIIIRRIEILEVCPLLSLSVSSFINSCHFTLADVVGIVWMDASKDEYHCKQKSLLQMTLGWASPLLCMG